MSLFQRIKNLINAFFLIVFAGIILLFAKIENSYIIILIILSVYLLVYGFRLLFYYFRMARHMVGGKNTLFQAIIALDLGLFTSSVISFGSVFILLYLVGVYAFSGIVDILRALEQKKLSDPGWKFKFIDGCLSVIFIVTIAIISIFFQSQEFLLYGFCATLFKSAIMKIIAAFRKGSVIYIQ